MTSVLALLLPLQLVRLPTVPYSSAVYHIHSPERFLEAHGLAPAGVRVTETFKPVATWGNNLIAFNFRTERGAMSGRMYSEEPSSSHIVILDEGERVCLMGRLWVKPDGLSGASIRVSTDMVLPVGAWDQAAAFASINSAAVSAAILAGEGGAEDANLRLYRRRVLRPPCA